MAQRDRERLEVFCPCCGARLKVDVALGKVIAHDPPPKPAKPAGLDHAAAQLEKEKARREELFKKAAEEQKVKSQLLQKKFEEALKKTKGEPPSRPTRDIDLD